MHGSSADRGNGKGKGRFWKRTDKNEQVKELGRDQRFTETPCTEMWQHTTYLQLVFPETYLLLEVQRKSANSSRHQGKNKAKSIKTIQVKPHLAEVQQEPVIPH